MTDYLAKLVPFLKNTNSKTSEVLEACEENFITETFSSAREILHKIDRIEEIIRSTKFVNIAIKINSRIGNTDDDILMNLIIFEQDGNYYRFISYKGSVQLSSINLDNHSKCFTEASKIT